MILPALLRMGCSKTPWGTMLSWLLKATFDLFNCMNVGTMNVIASYMDTKIFIPYLVNKNPLFQID